MSPAATRPARRASRRSPSRPTSENPAAKITANLARAAITSSNVSTAAPVRIATRSTGPGTSAIVRATGTPSTVSYVGCTGWNAAPDLSEKAFRAAVMFVLGRPGCSDAPITATDRGRKNVPRSTSRRRSGRPVTSTGGSTDGSTGDSTDGARDPGAGRFVRRSGSLGGGVIAAPDRTDRQIDMAVRFGAICARPPG
ncbi:MAG: hypothetical protein AMXMBFR46_10690 [Acidimicrobiia bacterium]